MSTILIVDDDENGRYLLRTMLTASGHVVLEASNGTEALAAARQSRPDLIISDILMPQMDGFALCRECKRDDLLREVPFVFYTATYTDPRDHALAMQLGAARFIVKPVENEVFIRAVREVLQDHAAGRLELPQRPPPDETVLYRLYNEALIRKLEDKMLELKQANQALSASEEYFRAIVENATDVIVVLDREGRIQYVSPAVEQTLGFKPEELVGQMIFDRVEPADLEMVRRALERGYSDPASSAQAVEVRYRHKDGSWRTLEAVGRRVTDKSGVPGAVVCLRDITERRRHERELESVATVSTALRAAESRMQMLNMVVERLAELLGAEGAGVITPDPSKGELLVEVAKGEWEKWCGVSVRLGEGITGHVLNTGVPYANADITTDPRLKYPHLIGVLRAAMCLPLVVKGRAIGAVWIGRRRPFLSDEVRLATAICEMAANALHRASLYEEVLRRLQQLEALQTIDRAITTSVDMQTTLEVLLDKAEDQLQADALAVLLFNPHESLLTPAAARGFRSRNYQRVEIRLGEGHAGRAALERHPVHVPDIRACEPPFVQLRHLEGEDFVSYYAVPLVAKGALKGVLEVFSSSPFHPDDEWRSFIEALALQAAIAIDNAQLFERLQQVNEELSLAYATTLEGWSRALDLRDRITEGHSQRVTELTVRLARLAGMKEDDIVHVRRGALLHDIGKMGIPDSILQKVEKLTEEERRMMREHPVIAYKLLSPIKYLSRALDIPYCHHEKWDGSGYPRGLKGEEIPLAARLFAVVDQWDALTSDRPYREAWSRERALAHIRDEAGKSLDPHVVELFLQLMEEETAAIDQH
ncbi:MAG: PAS domain S-box protein [Kiritimatiellae bacterium]|nr:PAS domain S-box protein [Kiritimatiellia bacterium]